MVINPESYGIISGCDCTEGILKLTDILTHTDEAVTVKFNNGVYYVDSEKCRETYRAITNTAAKDEYKDKNRVNIHRTPFLFENVKNVVFDGCGSEFVIDGKVTNMIISGCEHITFRNFKIKTLNPGIHKLTVIKTSPFKTVFRLNKESNYEKLNGKFYFTGKGYRFGFTEGAKYSSWNIVNLPENPDSVFRGRHPFVDSLKITEEEGHVFSVRYVKPKKFRVGQSFHIYNCLRSDIGIFAENSKNIVFENITQNFNYSLALVAQNCENITVESCRFAAEEGSGLDIASLADFMQLCMCKGKIKVNNCIFDGAGDDAINVHGMHFKVDSINGNTFNAVFGHPQTWGFNPFSTGDLIEFVDPSTLLPVDTATIINSQLISEQAIQIEIDKEIPNAYGKYVIENTTLCPELEYTNNTVRRIVTRGILYTSRGKCEIKGNNFINTGMSTLLFSDDARSWFESGRCDNVIIENNTFNECGKNVILILPENKRYAGAVHRNFIISGNTFRKYEGECIYAKATDNIEITNNTFGSDDKLKTIDCTNVKTDI